MIICDLCGEAKDCLQREIEGKEYDIPSRRKAERTLSLRQRKLLLDFARGCLRKQND